MPFFVSEKNSRCTVLAVTLSLSVSAAFAQLPPLALASGSFAGSDYAAGNGICRFYNLQPNRQNNCLAVTSPGGYKNLVGLKDGEFLAVIGQPDTAAEAFEGRGNFKAAGPNKNLRTLFAMGPRYITLVVPKDSPIQKIEDIKGKRVFLGAKGSATRENASQILSAYGIKETDFNIPEAIDHNVQGKTLCKHEVDALITVVGAGARYVKEAAQCGARLIGLSGAGAEVAISANPTLVQDALPAMSYPGQTEPIATLSNTTSVTTLSTLPNDTVYMLVKATFENIDALTQLHPSLSKLTPKKMARKDLGAPLHDGALRYYKEKGWL